MANKYSVEKISLINSPAEHIFNVLTDLTKWKQWTKSIVDISILGGTPFEVGSKLKAVQPKLRPAVWTVTSISPDSALTWEKNTLGLKIIANHVVQESNEGTVVKLQIIYRGFFAFLSYTLSSAVTDKYMTMEIAGLKKRCEASRHG